MKFRILVDSLLVGKDASNHFTDAIYYEPEDLANDNYARIFLHIEIKDNPKSSRIVTQSILNSLKKTIYSDLKKNPYDSFEDALKQVNNDLNILKHDHNDWVGKINATIGILAGETLHVTTTGKGEVILIRKNKSMIISDDLAPDKDDYDNLFVNIASGKLKEDDRLLISSTSILNILTEEQLINATRNKQLANAVLSLEKLIDDKYHCSLLLSIQAAFKDTKTRQEEDIDIDDIEDIREEEKKQENRPPKPLTKDRAKKYLGKSKSVLYKLKEMFIPPEGSEVVSEEVSDKDISDSLGNNYKPDLHNNTQDIQGIEKRESLDDIKNAFNKDTQLNNNNIETQDNDNKFKNTIDLLKQNVFQALKGTKPHKKTRNLFKKSNVIGIGIILIVAIFAINSVYSKHIENQEIEALRGKIFAIDNLIDKAKGRNIIDEKSKARDVLKEIDQAMNELSDSKYLKNEIEEKNNEIKKLSDSINEIIRVDVPKEYANLDAKYPGVKASNIVFLKDTLYVVSKDAIMKLLLDHVVLLPITGLKEGEEVSTASAFDSEGSILLFTNQNRIIEFKNDEFTENKLSNPDIKFKDAVALETFGRRIYLLDPNSDQLWKYAKQGLSFANPEEYKPFDVDLTKSIDVSVVGDIYFLQQGGEIVRTNRRKTQEFNFTEIPKDTDLSTSTRLAMNPTMKQLFILDPNNNRIVVTGYRGLYAKQFIFPNIGKLKDIFVNEDTRKLYVLTDDKVYEVDIES